MKIFFTVFFIFFVLWFSFFPQSVQNHCALYSKIFLVAVFLILLIHKRGARFLFHREDIFLWLFLGWDIFSVLFAYDKQAAWHMCADFVIPFIILYFLFKEELDFNKAGVILFVLFFSGIAVSIIGILEFIYKGNILYEHFFQNEYYRIYLSRSRIMSTMMVPAVLGTYLMCCLTVSYYIITITKKRIYKLFVLIGSGLILIAILFTFTRTTWIAVLITAIFYFYNNNKKILTVFMVFIFLLLGILALARLNPEINNRVRFDKMMDYLAYGHRLKRFPLTAKMIREHPFVGVGLDNYRVVFDKYYSPNKENDYSLKIPDNMYLMILGESGIVGLGLFILFIIDVIRRYLTALKNKDQNQRLLIRTLFVVFLGLLIHMLSYELLYWTTPFFLFLLFLGMLSGQLN